MRKFDEIIKILAEQQMQIGTHINNAEDFISVEDFYLEAVKKDSYEKTIEELTTEEEQQQYGKSEIWDAVRNYITENASLNDNILKAKEDVDSLEDYIKQYHNCDVAEIDNVGDIWIAEPQIGHWLSWAEKSAFLKWFDSI